MTTDQAQVFDGMLPDTMKDLMQQFLLRKDINSRVQIKFRMKALLDYAAADTEYPVNPLTAPDKVPTIQIPQMQDGGMAAAPMLSAFRPAPVPAADPQLQTSDILS